MKTSCRIFLCYYSVFRTILLITGFTITGCQNLDPFLWNALPLTEYELDDYSGSYRECDDAIDSLGPVDMSEVHFVTFQSGTSLIWSVLLNTRAVFDPGDTLVLYFYGRTFNIDYYWPRTRLIYEAGFPTMIVEFPGYGKSSGEPSEQSLYEMGRSALGYIRDSLGNPAVIIYAYSTGTFIACELASKDSTGQIHRLILEAPYSSMETMVQDGAYLNIPGSYVTTIRGENTVKIRSVTIPLLLLYGTVDRTLNPLTHGLLLWKNYSGTGGCLFPVEGADHTEVPQALGYFEYAASIRSFITGNTEFCENVSP